MQKISSTQWAQTPSRDRLLQFRVHSFFERLISLEPGIRIGWEELRTTDCLDVSLAVIEWVPYK